MLNEDGTISFAEEIAEAVDAFLNAYQARKGLLQSDLERGLVISYILGVMRCDLDALWDCLAQSRIFGGLHPRVVFDDCLGHDEATRASRRAALEEALNKRGWPCSGRGP